MQRTHSSFHLFILVLLTVVATPSLWAHPNNKLHCNDFYAVLPFERCKTVDDWMTSLSSKLIDNYKGEPRREYGGLAFYDHLKKEFPGFSCKHRALFHWGYNSRPWNSYLEKKALKCTWGSDPAEMKRFQQAIITEQKLRNGKANALTEQTFGFASGGKDASYANALISIVYDVHILGDWSPVDNNDFDGLPPIGSTIGDIINSLRKLDAELSKPIIKKIQKASRLDISDQEKSVKVFDILKSDLPSLIKQAQGGEFQRRWSKMGFKLK